MRFAVYGLLLGLGSAAWAQTPQPKLTCDGGEHWGRSSQVTHCEMREQKFASLSGPMTIDTGGNGGISLHGWDRADVLVRARVRATADTEQAAKDLAQQVHPWNGTDLRASASQKKDNEYWSVDYEIFAPRTGSFNANTVNGGIHADSVQGSLHFESTNGGVTLENANGDVAGKTKNGGITVKLSGDRWVGKGLDVETTNGGISIKATPQYSAHLDVSTVNGGVARDGAHVMRAGRLQNEAFDLGSGGPTLHLRTKNGGISVNTGTRSM